MPPKFLYFDLGRVLVDFSVPRMLAQIAAVAGCSEEVVRRVVFDEGLQHAYEEGRLTSEEYYEAFCRAAQTHPPIDALAAAGADIFEIYPSILPIVSQLRQAGYRLGILSNTCDLHWEHCRGRYTILAELFEVYALSYRIGAAKPGPTIYLAAAELAGCRPEELFFVDDLPANVEGARAVGIDAVLYTTPAQLAADLRTRGVRFNY